MTIEQHEASPDLDDAATTYDIDDIDETAFTVENVPVTFGPGALREVGLRAAQLGMRRVALFTDATVAKLEVMTTVRRALRQAKVDFEEYSDVAVEPTDQSFKAAILFATGGQFDGYISVGGGSVLDTCKAANLYACYPPDDFLDYVNAPIGRARPIPGPLKPHIACPTTCGTGSECTGIAIFDLLAMDAKTGIASPRLRPSHALVDPTCTATLPPLVVAASGLDVLCHALESYTARPFTCREAPANPLQRPLSQGANPWSDMGCREALRLGGKYLAAAVNDPSDETARHQLMWAATLAGIAFGNSGVHIPHAMAYSVAGLVRDYRPPGYPNGAALVPHGISVIVNAPAVFRLTAATNPERHLQGAALIGADIADADPAEGGERLAQRLIELMRAVKIPNGLSGLGYGGGDIEALVEGAWPQQRLLQNAPLSVERADLAKLYRNAMRYW